MCRAVEIRADAFQAVDPDSFSILLFSLGVKTKLGREGFSLTKSKIRNEQSGRRRKHLKSKLALQINILTRKYTSFLINIFVY
jgi:hypothetical protein